MLDSFFSTFFPKHCRNDAGACQSSAIQCPLKKPKLHLQDAPRPRTQFICHSTPEFARNCRPLGPPDRTHAHLPWHRFRSGALEHHLEVDLDTVWEHFWDSILGSLSGPNFGPQNSFLAPRQIHFGKKWVPLFEPENGPNFWSIF